MKILVTGGAGYIGSHTCVELLNNGYDVIVYDNLSNSCEKSLERVKEITGKTVKFIKGDILDKVHLDEVFTENQIDCVINFAGLKAVGESVKKPLEYYHTNITGAINILESMREHNCFKFIFSSSATVYGDPVSVPVDETFKTGGTTNPYGTTKLFIEQILMDLYHSDPRFQICILRYFNPIGAHPSGLIGEDPNGIPNNLAPYITQVMIGRRDHLTIFGDDYDTPDGTCIRDYIHVNDLADAHIRALNYLYQGNQSQTFNLGNGEGYSVLEIINAAKEVTQLPIHVTMAPRRAGDPAKLVADNSKAKEILGWQPQYTDIKQIIQTAWNFHLKNSK